MLKQLRIGRDIPIDCWYVLFVELGEHENKSTSTYFSMSEFDAVHVYTCLLE